MSKPFQRTARIEAVLQRELVRLIQREIKNPRLERVMISISQVKVSRDLSYAKIYITALGEQEMLEPKEIIAILNEAAPFLRGELGRCLTFRTIPKLTFIYDYAIEQAERLEHLIEQAVLSDKKRSSSQDD